jgi:hypothetical protein
MLNLRFSGSGLFLVTLLLAVVPASLRAGDVSWDVSGLAFSDDGMLTGTFVYDADTGMIHGWNLTTMGGDPVNFPNFTYTPANSSFSVSGNTLVFQGPLFPAINPNASGFRQLRIGPFNMPLGDSGGGRDLVADSFGNVECYNCGPTRALGGSISGTPLPRPDHYEESRGKLYRRTTCGHLYHRGDQFRNRTDFGNGCGVRYAAPFHGGGHHFRHRLVL